MKFRDLSIGQTFDCVDDAHRTWNSFYDPCRKVSNRRYVSLNTGIQYTVGSINCTVYHVGEFDNIKIAANLEVQS